MKIRLIIPKFILLTIGLLYLSTSISAQEPKVLRVSQIKEGSLVSERLQRNGDHFYTIIAQLFNDDESRDLTEDLEINSFNMVDIPNSHGVVASADYARVILDYQVGEGIVSYDYISNCGLRGDYYKNDSIVVTGHRSNHCTWNGKTYVPQELPETSEFGGYITVINHVKEELMFSTKTNYEGNRLEVDQLTVDGENLYVVTRTNEDTFEFMGEFFPEVIDPNWNVKHIHKINWKTGVKEWSRQFNTDIDQDYLHDIKVVEDGNLIIATKIYGKTYWDGVPIPGNTVYDGGSAFYKISPDGDLIDYMQSICDCVGFKKAHIEDDGSLMLYGAQINMPNLTLGDVEIQMNAGLVTGIFGYVPPDWKNPWIKTYPSTYIASVIGGTKSIDKKEIIPFVAFQESANIEGFKLDTEDKGMSDPSKGRSETALLSYKEAGTLIKNPISIPLDARLYEVQEIEKNHYLFYMYQNINEPSTLYETKLGKHGFESFIFFEVEGDLFDIVSNLDDLIKPYLGEMKVYPNPALSEGEVSVELLKGRDQITGIYLTSINGEKIQLENYNRAGNNVKIQLPSVPSGTYFLNVADQTRINQTRIVIK